MDTIDKEIIIEKFISRVDYDLDETEQMISFLKSMDPKQDALIKDVISMIRKKINKVKKAESLDDAKKYLKVKKIVENCEELVGDTYYGK